MARADRSLAFAAFVLALTALWLPWWVVAWNDGLTVVRQAVRVFAPQPPLTTAWGPWLTGVLAAAAALVLFVRLGAKSHLLEPRDWRRDLAVSAGILLLAAASCLLWPAGTPSFWGGRTYVPENGTGPSIVETDLPGLGWWLALLAAGLAAVAWWMAGKPRPPETDPSTAGDTIPK
jgi:hypothetical protein